ncbi:MAG TPA: DNA-formamidopyrimidine glycosylase family protein [Anaerolineaceae bacterium]|nr:DNA-formamidopyrimidine glycosylase family protein [Anaerolineaceae bacterium]
MAFELPEAVTLARQMQAALPGKRIAHIELSPACASLIRQGFINLNEMPPDGQMVDSCRARGKWIFVRLEDNLHLCFALETKGKILYHPSPLSLPPRWNIKVNFSDGTSLTVHIIGWGFAKALPEKQIPLEAYPGVLGVCPISDDFTPAALSHLLHENPRKTIKSILTDQRLIAGIGIGYAQEICYQSRLHPARKCITLDPQQRAHLYWTARSTLEEAVRLGGSEHETDLYDQPGSFPRQVCEATRGKPCPQCSTPIERTSVQGASMYICPQCQAI